MLFERVAAGGCLSYLIGCEKTCAGLVVDPHLGQIDRYLALAARHGVRIRHLVDTHTHADHFSAAGALARRLDATLLMHRASPAPFVDTRLDDGECIVLGELRVGVMHTPGHTRDSICLVAGDKLFTGDTLLLRACGRTDLPTGDPSALYESLFGRLLELDDALLVCPAHDYEGRDLETLGRVERDNPRLQKKDRAEFVEMMTTLNLRMPTHLTEALRTNSTGGKTVAQLIDEAARQVPFMALEEVERRLGTGQLTILDVRERDAYEQGHVPGALHVPRGQLELRIDEVLPDPAARVLCCCEVGKISTLAAATLKSMGFSRAVALDGGMKAWREAGRPTETTE